MVTFREFISEATGDGTRRKLLKLIPDYIKNRDYLDKENQVLVKDVKRRFGKTPDELSSVRDIDLRNEIRSYIDNNYQAQVKVSSEVTETKNKIETLLYKLPRDSAETEFIKQVENPQTNGGVWGQSVFDDLEGLMEVIKHSLKK